MLSRAVHCLRHLAVVTAIPQSPWLAELGHSWMSSDTHATMDRKHISARPDPRTEDNHFVEDPDFSELEDKLLDQLRKEKSRQKTIKFQRVRRQLTPAGAPERTLSWDAIQQIRYLKRELPEEWTLERLAEGFAVSSDVIARVLRGGFVPPPERRMKQDAKALASPDRSHLSRSTAASLPAGITEGLITWAIPKPGEGQTVTTVVPFYRRDHCDSLELHSTVPHSRQSKPAEMENQTTVMQEVEEEEGWNGRVFSDKELEELSEALPEQNCLVVKKGREFFDSGGNFLYRI